MEVYILLIMSNMQKSEDHPSSIQMQCRGKTMSQGCCSGILQWDIQLHQGNVRVIALSNGEAAHWRVRAKKRQVAL